MKAIVLSAFGGPEKLELKDQPEPEPGAGQVKVRVASASLNPVDWKQRSGALQRFMPVELPLIPGRDAAGEVVSVGAGVSRVKPGDLVLGVARGTYAEFVVAPEKAWAKLPDGMPVQDAGAYPLVLLTGDQLVNAALGAAHDGGSGLVLLVTGAIGAVGRVAVWVAKQRGARVLAGVRSKQLEAARELGADGVIAIDDEASIARMPEVDRIADAVDGETIAKLLPKLKKGGILGSALGEPAAAKARGIKVNAFQAQPEPQRLHELASAVANGSLVVPIANRFPLGQAAEAHALAERGGVGKVLLTV
ncbi:MAG TPA: NADP-dependent oxidoreductase [Polyangiaceae bacterium]|nr:NADP-dependent oxidoreductase [Polyangiaceae bacterium]